MHLREQTKIMQNTTEKNLDVLMGTSERCIEIPQMKELKNFGEKVRKLLPKR